MAYIMFKHDGIVEKLDYSREKVEEILNTFSTRMSHCNSCGNCYAHKCEKVADIEKKPIAEYDFITRGFDIVSNNGETSLYIDICENKIKDRPTKKLEICELREPRIKRFQGLSDIRKQPIEESVKMLKKTR